MQRLLSKMVSRAITLALVGGFASSLAIGEIMPMQLSEPARPVPQTRATPLPPAVHLLVALVWQGRSVDTFNLAALNDFRARFPEVPFIHFLSPAYFTKADANLPELRTKIRSVMRPKDKLGMQLGAWRSLTKVAGVPFRSTPTFWGERLATSDCAIDCGLDVAINSYPDSDVEKLMNAGLDTLAANGFGRPRALAVEGWLASTEILTAAVRSGFRYDFSGVTPELLSRQARAYPLFQWVKNLWPNMTALSQPYIMATPSGSLAEIPQSLASLDYLTEADVKTAFKQYADHAHSAQGDLTMSLVLYQESAKAHLPQLARGIEDIRLQAAQRGVQVLPMDLPDLDIPAPQTQAPAFAPMAH